ncbi:MAG: GGDEF domain-containing protein [Pseudomonadales bacterium]
MDLYACTSFPLSVVLFDLDGFKTVNDTYGHDTGDRLLALLSSIMKSILRETDISFRQGGDEFCVLFQDTEQKYPLAVMERVLERFQKEQVKLIDKKDKVGFSGGCGCFLSTDRSSRNALARADVLLYEAKKQAKGQILYAKSH